MGRIVVPDPFVAGRPRRARAGRIGMGRGSASAAPRA
jgi:hypothetical protein